MVPGASHQNWSGKSTKSRRMKFLVTLAICAVCVSGESLTRHKRGWGYEPTPPPPTQSPGWGWNPPPQTTQPPPPPPPPPTSGWGKPPPPTQGWGQPPPPQNGWGSSSSSYSYPSYYNSRYPRPWGQSRYGRYAEGPQRYRDYRDYRDRDRGDIYGSIRSPYSRRSSSLM